VRVRTRRVYVVLPITVETVSVVVAVQLNVRGSYRVKVTVGMKEVSMAVNSNADDEATVLVSVAVEVAVLT